MNGFFYLMEKCFVFKMIESTNFNISDVIIDIRGYILIISLEFYFHYQNKIRSDDSVTYGKLFLLLFRYIVKTEN